MNLIKKTFLTDGEKKDILSLVKICQDYDNIKLSLPVEEGDIFYFLYDNQNLLSVLSLFFPEEGMCECCCFTKPENRKRKCFSTLFKAALADIDSIEKETGSDLELYFMADITCPATSAVLEKLEAQYMYSEYMMEYNFKRRKLEPSFPSIDLDFKKEEDNISIPPEHLSSELKRSCILCQIYKAGHGPVGSFYLSCMGKKTVYFFGFQISEKFQRQGLGGQSLINTLHILRTASFQKVVLQVSENNEAACSLYKKTGFQIMETLSYYCY